MALEILRRRAVPPDVTVDLDRLKVTVHSPHPVTFMISEATIWVHTSPERQTAVLTETRYHERVWWVSLHTGPGVPPHPLLGLGFRAEMELAAAWLEELAPWKGLIVD